MNASLAARLVVVLFGSALAASTVACSGSSADGESVDSSKLAVQTGKDGTPTGNGKTCSWPVSVGVGWGVATPSQPTQPTQPSPGKDPAAECGSEPGSGNAPDSANCAPNPIGPHPGPGPKVSPAPTPVTPVVEEHQLGDWFPSPDACNRCTCTEIGIMCTVEACSITPTPVDPGPPVPVTPPPSKGCSVDGKYVSPGTSVPSSDGCNTCSCTADGNLACTERACVNPVLYPTK